MKSAYRGSFSVSANWTLMALLLVLLGVSQASAQSESYATRRVPTGKGWSEEHAYAPLSVVTGNGVSWYGGPIMPGSVHVYYIWYGNWLSGPKLSDSQASVNLLNALFGATGGIGGSGYAQINTTYGDATANVTGNMALTGSTTDKLTLRSLRRTS